ncbi:hypothetical protein CRI94_16050 [Longibacter salinarum]|uniref:Uncharacterized protein n=1 Tax=Longibacter salinarum TaxID=1850348 RepID=A0A2A8CUS9_9BACT|nr:hypothetical protein [Longibacter salinarum]PEN11301.1 hypothetical protein CRI94_16050 [Longibacter salinarum]
MPDPTPTYTITGSVFLQPQAFRTIESREESITPDTLPALHLAVFAADVRTAGVDNALATVALIPDTDSQSTGDDSFRFVFDDFVIPNTALADPTVTPSVFFRIFPKKKDGTFSGALARSDEQAQSNGRFPVVISPLPGRELSRTGDRSIPLYQGTGGEDVVGRIEAIFRSEGDVELAEVARIQDQTLYADPDIIDNLSEETKDVRLTRPEANPTRDQALWVAIRQRTDGLRFGAYKEFIDQVFCENTNDGQVPNAVTEELRRKQDKLKFGLVTTGNVEAYNLLRVATDAFLLLFGCGDITIDTDAYEQDLAAESSRLQRSASHEEIRRELTDYLTTFLGRDRLPYIQQVVTTNFSDGLSDAFTESPFCYGISNPDPCMIELIWSYWHESGMLVQALSAISLRFQNKSLRQNDPLANLTLDPLRPLNNLIWGFVQNEFQRLSVSRRVHEYAHQYGLALEGKAVPQMRTADSRVHFLEAFHNLLLRCSQFYIEDNNTTIISDGFALLNALKEVHILLAQGAHNQYGDLPWTARSEMMTMQYMLSRDEMREFLRGRPMVPYQEEWMGQVDIMNTMQGWTGLPVNHFRDLGVYGEQLLLSIRLGDWVQTIDQDRAKNWARYWRSEVKSYIHAYQALTGIDLSAAPPNATIAKMRTVQPAKLIRRRTNQLRKGNGTKRIPGAVQSELTRQSSSKRRSLR